ncbi:MAG: hypothetical protein Q8R67_22285 [Rhodoferax sp.]|nr:hypothetical protein [Rhodoferax sp.]MDP3654402.1 hypothetical protein [Rhodoferax sp.]
MDSAYIFAIVACLLGAGGMYVVVEFRLHGERQQGMSKLLKAQVDTAAAKKETLAFTKYTEYLPAGKVMLTDKLKLLLVKVVREHAYTETIPREQFKLKANVLIVVRYAVEYSFNLDLKPEQFELRATPAGIDIQLRKPLLLGFPAIKLLSHELGMEESQIDQKSVVNEIQVKLPALVRKFGTAIASEEATLALCEKKLVDCLREFLAAQQGVKQVPAITVTYR